MFLQVALNKNFRGHFFYVWNQQPNSKIFMWIESPEIAKIIWEQANLKNLDSHMTKLIMRL